MQSLPWDRSPMWIPSGFNIKYSPYAISLATFKRDFEKFYHTTPRRWLQQRRLQESYHRIKELKESPSDVYLELGFENLSHFSFVFKKAYGIVPSKL